MVQPGVTQTAIPVFALPESPGTPTSDRSAWQRAMLTSGLRPATKLVALAVSVHAAPTPPPAAGSGPTMGPGVAACAPGLAALVEEVGYSRSHVLRQIRLLRDHSWLTVVGRPAPGRPTVYGLTLPAAASPPPRPARIVSDAPSRAARRRRATRGRISTASLDALTTPPTRASGLVDLLDGTANAPGVRPLPLPVPHAAAQHAAAQPVATRPTQAAPTQPVAPEPAPTRAPRPARTTQVPLPGTSAPAAVQVVAALARALRCDPTALDRLTATVCELLDAGAWPAVELAAHLADGVPVAVEDPAALLDSRLGDLPAEPGACGCRPCVSLRPAARRRPTAAPDPRPADEPVTQGRGTRVARTPRRRPANTAPAGASAPSGSPVTRPDLGAIAAAAAAGAAQARNRRDISDS